MEGVNVSDGGHIKEGQSKKSFYDSFVWDPADVFLDERM
jgi:hypothetical protein